MAFDRNHWQAFFHESAVPPFRCPTCGSGILRLDRKSLRKRFSTRMKAYEKHPEFEVDWLVGRFTCQLVCTVENCGEVVGVTGDTVMSDMEDDDGRQVWGEHLKPFMLTPPPPIIEIPPETPTGAVEALIRAFRAFWGDRGAAANHLRTCVERILDDQKVEGKILQQRIDKFAKAFPEYKVMLHALREVGNVGSHEGDIHRGALLDAFEVIQEGLRELYGKHRSRIEKLATRLVENKGNFKRRYFPID